MIKYRPNRATLSASIKEEKTFETVDDMKCYLFERCCKVSNYLGAEEPFRMDDLIITDHTVCIRRGISTVYRTPFCIGSYYGES